MWSAPGKLFLFGEYAILRGAPAIVTAVDRRVRIERQDGADYSVVDGASDLRLPEAVARAMNQSLAGLRVDLSQMNSDGVKIGLGSSAASAVALVAAMSSELEADRVYPLAFAAHRDFQEQSGSGADIAASTFGGTVVVRPRDADAAPSVERIDWPQGLHVYTVWTGAAASTRKLVRTVEQGGRQMAHLCQLAEAAVVAFADGDVERLVVIASDYDNAMGKLGAGSGVAIRTRTHARIAKIAREFGASAKPSGAGGGDVTLVMSNGPLDGDLLARSLPSAASLIDLGLGADGVRREAS